MNYLNMFLNNHAQGKKNALYSCCSANDDVLSAAIKRAIQTGSVVLIEATANQVNQFGGYTGKTPIEFAAHVKELATNLGLPADRLILGGDHLGPLVWSSEEEETAMKKAEKLVRLFVAAGYRKIHLDTSMRLASDDPNGTFSAATCARRGARLCQACESEAEKLGLSEKPIYIIGSEVPVPGGEVGSDPSSNVTTCSDYDITLSAYKEAFKYEGLEDAFDRIASVVVKMGVEFSEYRVSEYCRKDFSDLAAHTRKAKIGFEAHSTDYQTAKNLAQMREDGAMFLKVGPALTFAARSALFKLELIEKEIVDEQVRSHYRQTLDNVMVSNPIKWQGYYHGTDDEQSFARAFSFSDRCRYYSDIEQVRQARNTLIANLTRVGMPQCLLLEYFKNQYDKIRIGELRTDPEEVLHDSIGDAIDCYLYATNNNEI